MGTGWSWLRIGTGGGYLWVRCGTLGFHKCGEFLDYLQSLLVSFSRRTLLHGVSMNFKETECEIVDGIQLAHIRIQQDTTMSLPSSVT